MTTRQFPSMLTVERVKEHFVDGLNVFVSGGAGQPDALINVIEQAALSSRLRIIDNSLPTMTQLNPNQFSSQALLNTGFFIGITTPRAKSSLYPLSIRHAFAPLTKNTTSISPC